MPTAKTAPFTNNSGQTVMVLSGKSESNTAPQQGYEQTLTLLTFEDGGTTLETGRQSTLNLPPDQLISNLLISNPATLAPIKAVGEVPDRSAPGGYPKPYKAITVTQDDADQMTQALAFCQNIMASPSSQMAAAFEQALDEAGKADSVDDMDSIMTTFFQGYPSFETVTYPSYSAVHSYLKTFALAWVQPNAASDPGQGGTYYVYSAPEAGEKGAKSEGTIQATRAGSPPDIADPEDPLSGYEMVLSNGDNSIPLSYGGGVFTDETHAISLSATYTYQGKFTGKLSDVQLWPILVGTMLGKKVMAIPTKPSNASSSTWNDIISTLEHPTFDKLLHYFVVGMGLWMSLDFLKHKLSSKKNSLERDRAANNNDRDRGADPTPEQVQRAQQNADAVGNAYADAANARGQAVSGDVEFVIVLGEADIEDLFQEVRNVSWESTSAVAHDMMKATVDRGFEMVGELAEVSVNDALNDAEGHLEDASNHLLNGDMGAANESIKLAHQSLKTTISDAKTKLSQEAREAYKEKVEANEEAREEAEREANREEEAKDGNDPEGEGPEFDPVEG